MPSGLGTNLTGAADPPAPHLETAAQDRRERGVKQMKTLNNASKILFAAALMASLAACKKNDTTSTTGTGDTSATAPATTSGTSGTGGAGTTGDTGTGTGATGTTGGTTGATGTTGDT